MADELEIESRFRSMGGTFLTPTAVLVERMKQVRALVFDWDGVFNTGTKGDATSSTYCEPDSMGVNMLRFSLWREAGLLPICAIVSGEINPTARAFAVRENFHDIYCGAGNKRHAISSCCSRHNLAMAQIAFFFDDINDLGIAAECGVRVLIRRDASPLLQDFVAMNSLCDYITAHSAGHYPVREAAELLMGLLGSYDLAVASRMSADSSYAEYLGQRKAIQTQYFDRLRGEFH